MLNYFKEMLDIIKQTSLTSFIRYLAFKNSISLNFLNFYNKPKSKKTVLLGSGTYAASILLPAMSKMNLLPHLIVSRSHLTSSKLSKAWGLPNSGISIDDFMNSDISDLQALVIATPNNTHPYFIEFALKRDLYTYCEKPVAVDLDGIKKLFELRDRYPNSKKVMIGFNRRFSPAIKKVLALDWIFRRKEPLEITYRVNFGKRISNSLSNDVSGGGRLIGAGCHYVDLICHIIGKEIKYLYAQSGMDENTYSVLFKFIDNSIANLIFTSDGNRDFGSKEEISISSEGHNIRIIDFKNLKIDKKKYFIYRRTYGAFEAMNSFYQSVSESKSVQVPLLDGIIATCVTLAIRESIESNTKIVFSEFKNNLMK